MIFDIPTPFDYGAAGGGANDTTAVQNALNAASSSPFRRCSLAGGTFVVSSVTVPAGVTITGPGLLVQLAGVFAAPLRLNNAGASALDFEIDGNKAAQTTANMGIEYSAADLLISGMHVHHVAQDGITGMDGALRVTVEKCHIHDTGRVGATINGTTAAHIIHDRNYVHDTGEAGMGIMGSATHASFTNNQTKDTGGDGIAGYSDANRHVTAVGNHVKAPRNHGIHISGDSTGITGNDIEGVTNGHGIFFRKHDVTTMYGGTITGNIIQGVTPGSGIRVESTEKFSVTGNYVETGATDQWGIYLARANDGSVTGNTVVGSGSAGNAGGTVGIRIGSSNHIAVTGNHVKGFRAGVQGFQMTAADPVSTNVSVAGNTFNDVTTPVFRNAETINWDVRTGAAA